MDNFEVVLPPKARKFYENCASTLIEPLNKCFTQLEVNPFRGKDIKYLKSHDIYRYRIGSYRVIYDINKQEKKVGILLIDKRGDVYKKI